MNKKQIIIAIVGAAVIGGCTQATAYFPNITEILVAVNVLVSAIVSYVGSQNK